jgi:holo-[acyl-carrier protein] synthase
VLHGFHFTDYRLPFTVSVMIVGTGVDITEVPRIASTIQRFGERFVKRVFTEREIRYCESKQNKTERYAARFAAKEAALKAIGTGWRRGITWRDVEVTREPSGRPTLAFHGIAAEFASKLGVRRVHISLSHTVEHAIAHVILED